MRPASLLSSLLTAAVLTVLTSCGGGQTHTEDGKSLPMRYAAYLSITDLGNCTIADITNPWDTARLLHRYILVPSDSTLPADLPEGTLIRTPIDRIIVYSSVHASIIDMLGEAGRIAGVCEPEYMTCGAVRRGIAAGTIIDCGNSVSPSIERIADAGGQVIIASPFANSGYGAAGKLGIPIIEAADYMENLPLGRTEWVRLFGALLECPEKADSLFLKAESEYNDIKNKVTQHIEDRGGDSHRPTLLAERKYGASWDVPGGASYMVRLYEDAGADYIFGNNASTANVNMSFENVLKEGIDADIWVLKYWSERPMTYTSLQEEYHLYTQFKAFRQHRIFGCNTFSSTYYDDIVLHPAWILADLAAVFHPDLMEGYGRKYFQPLTLN